MYLSYYHLSTTHFMSFFVSLDIIK